MIVWRIATDTPDYTADDLSGTGAKNTGGRWNRPKLLAVLYCANTPSLACLETLAHLGASSLPLNRYLVEIDIPDPVWKIRQTHMQHSMPVGWDAIPAGKVSLNFGDAWLRACKTAVMVVPSAIVPEDSVILINPQHPDSVKITSRKIRKWLYDPRLR